MEAGRATRPLARAATRKLIDGQAQDISYEHRERVTVEECLEMEAQQDRCAARLCRLHRRGASAGRTTARPSTLEAYGATTSVSPSRPPTICSGMLGDPGGHRSADLE